MNVHEAFVHAVFWGPFRERDTHRLIYADKMEEEGNPACEVLRKPGRLFWDNFPLDFGSVRLTSVMGWVTTGGEVVIFTSTGPVINEDYYPLS